MSKETIIQKIIDAINIFIEKEKFLLENDLNERTITYKLAIYIEHEFSEYDIDCEYNKFRESIIDEDFSPKELYLPKKEISSNDTKATTVYPDIIVHKRGEYNNLLIIEIKKEKYANKNYKYKENKITYRDFDKKKIIKYMEQENLNYQYGLYLEFNKTNYSGIFYYKETDKILSINLSS